MKMIWLVLVVLSVLVSCATTLSVEPTETQRTLVVGEIKLHAKNFEHFGDATLSGDHTKWIEVTIYDLTNDKTIKTSTIDDNGFFYFPAEKNSRYRITKLYIKIQHNGWWADLVATPANLIFDVGEGKIYDAGEINWSADHARKSYAMMKLGPESDLRAYLQKTYPKSKWNELEWDSATWLR